MNFNLIINAVSYPLDNDNPLTVIDIDGLPNAEAKPLTERGPLQDGDSDLGVRLQPRLLMVKLQAVTTATNSYASNRQLINRLFRSSLRSTFEIIFDDGSVRRIDVRSLGGYSLPSNLMNMLRFETVIPLRAAYPIFYDPNLITINFALAVGTNGFTVPTPVPSFVGSSTIDVIKTIAYAGTYQDYPLIEIYGPVTSPVITNLTTGATIDFTGITIANGDYYTIDLRYGRKFVYRNGDTSDIRTGETTNNSNLATFSLQPDPIVPLGMNDIKVTGTAASPVTQIYLQYYNRYDGV